MRLSSAETIGAKRVPSRSPFTRRTNTSGSVPCAMTTVVPERRARSAACSLVTMPPVPNRVPLPPAASHNAGGISGPVTSPTSCAARIHARVGGEQAGLVGEQDQQIGFDHIGDERGEIVVIAHADLLGGNGIVLVDDGQDARARAGRAGCCAR